MSRNPDSTNPHSEIVVPTAFPRLPGFVPVRMNDDVALMNREEFAKCVAELQLAPGSAYQ